MAKAQQYPKCIILCQAYILIFTLSNLFLPVKDIISSPLIIFIHLCCTSTKPFYKDLNIVFKNVHFKMNQNRCIRSIVSPFKRNNECKTWLTIDFLDIAQLIWICHSNILILSILIVYPISIENIHKLHAYLRCSSFTVRCVTQRQTGISVSDQKVRWCR